MLYSLILRAEPFAYVTDSGSDQVLIIDLQTASVKGSIPVGSNPVAIVLTPDSIKGFVCNNDSNFISVIDVKTNKVIDTISVPGPGLSLALDGQGKYLYAATYLQQIYKIDIETNQVVDSISIDFPLEKLGVSFDGSYLIGICDIDADANPDAIWIEWNDPSNPVDLGRAHSVASDISGQYAYITNSRTKIIKKVKFSDHSQTTFNIDDASAAITRVFDQGDFFINSGGGVLQMRNDIITKRSSFNKGPFFSAAVDSLQRYFVCCGDRQGIYIVNLENGSIQSIFTDREFYGVAISKYSIPFALNQYCPVKYQK